MLLRDKKDPLKTVFRFVGFLDVLCSISLLRSNLPYYCIPQKDRPDNRLHAEAIYHPLIKNNISNDLILGRKSVLITGSNMSGKTSFIRTVGINLLFAKILHTCLARRFEISEHLRLSSAINTLDSPTNGKSYFMQEAEQIKKLIEQSSEGNYLFLLDEPFKGTNTHERIAISKAVLAALAKAGNIVLATTHDPEIAELLDKEFDLYNFSTSIQNNEILFDYKLKKGTSKEQNAIKLLELCQYPEKIIREAYSFNR